MLPAMLKHGGALFAAVMIVSATLPARADGPAFSQALDPAQFQAAGLQKLTPEERAQLDALISAYQSGALVQAQRQAAEAQAAQAAAEARAHRAEADAQAAQAAAEARTHQAEMDAKAAQVAAASAQQAEAKAKADAASKTSLLNRARALISPGTKIEYAPIESRIVGSLTGWDANTIFVLENGQQWQVSNYSHYFNGKPVVNPAATVRPVHLFGGFEITIEGLGAVRVRLVNGPTYREN